MIKIIKKQPQVSFNDRVIGVKGDNETAYREFVIDRIQGEIDLANYVPLIEINPVNKNEPSYYDLLTYKVVDNSIYMRWDIKSHNTKDDGNLEFQIYFGQTDDESIKVFQTYTDYFSIAKGIEGKEIGEDIEPDLFEQAILKTAEQAGESAKSAKQSADSAKKAEDALNKITTPNASAESVDYTQEVSVTTEEVGGRVEFKFKIPKGKPGENGQPGADGNDGLTPYVGANGNWWIGSIDTKVKAQGVDGKPGQDGYSPTISVEVIDECTRIIITDKNTTHYIDIPDGASAYDIAVGEGFVGTESEWLESLKGQDGDSGIDGMSAYEIACFYGFDGTEEEWLDSLNGEPGDTGEPGQDGYSPSISVEETDAGVYVTVTNKDNIEEFEIHHGLEGSQGLSAYEVASIEGFEGSEEEWLQSLKGEDGEDAYPIVIDDLQYNMEVYLEVNKVYNMTIDKHCNFVLPAPKSGQIEQILVMANVVTENIFINWGTEYFFDRYIPTIMVGECDIVFESNGKEWYAGIMTKGIKDEQGGSVYYIPKRGIDYWTEEDKSEIVNDVFDVISAEYNTEYKGKTLSILGASYDLVNSKYDVNNEDEIWWGMVCKALGMAVLKNNSISGSTVAGDTENSGCQTRCEDLHVGTDNPDVIIIAMGGNDFKNEIPLGTYDGNGDFPTDTSAFREAYAIMLNKILTKYPDAEVFVCTRPYIFECNGDVAFPEKNESGILFKEWNEAIIDIANLFGVRVVDQTKCGITWQNRKYFGGDYKEDTGWVLHPNKWGQAAMANEIIRTMAPWCSTRFPIRENLALVEVEWEMGTIYQGVNKDSTTRLRTVGGIGRNVYTLSCTPDYTMLVCVPLQTGISAPLYYDKSRDTYITSATGLWSNYFDLRKAYNSIGNAEVRIILKRVDDGEITLADTQNVHAKGVIIE